MEAEPEAKEEAVEPDEEDLAKIIRQRAKEVRSLRLVNYCSTQQECLVQTSMRPINK